MRVRVNDTLCSCWPTGSRVAARRAVAANLFAGAALYVSPDYAKNAAGSLAKVPAGGPDAQRIKVVQVRPAHYAGILQHMAAAVSSKCSE
jgi:cellulase/cellobiase CelA1